jgi:GxxExxY protein
MDRAVVCLPSPSHHYAAFGGGTSAAVWQSSRSTGTRLIAEITEEFAVEANFLGIQSGSTVAPLHPMLVDTPFNHVTNEIIGAAIEVHRHLGPGLLESTYLPCLEYELTARRLHYARQRAVPIVYKSLTLDASYRIDLIVEDLVIVELKSVEHVLPVHKSQVLTYLHVTGCPAGLLLNFNVPKMIDGLTRLLNTKTK